MYNQNKEHGSPASLFESSSFSTPPPAAEAPPEESSEHTVTQTHPFNQTHFSSRPARKRGHVDIKRTRLYGTRAV